MIKTSLLIAAVSATALLLVRVDAREEFKVRIPNGANVNGVDALGHQDGKGSSDALNAFGAAFQKAGEKWTTELCQADSDGDGQTNGEELGDPCCVWTKGGTPKFTDGVSNPGDPSKTVAATTLASNLCSAGASSSTTTTNAPAAATSAPAASSSATQAIVASSAAAVAVAAVLTHW